MKKYHLIPTVTIAGSRAEPVLLLPDRVNTPHQSLVLLMFQI